MANNLSTLPAGFIIDDKPENILPDGFVLDSPKDMIQKQNALGNVFNVPGAASRAAIRSNPALALAGPFAGALASSGIVGKESQRAANEGALRPDEIKTFRQESLDTPISNRPDQPVRNFFKGLARDAVGMGADILTNPAEVAGMFAGKLPVGPKFVPEVAKQIGRSRMTAGELVAQTKPVKELTKFVTAERNLPTFKGQPVDQLEKVIETGINKAIRPSISGKSNAGQAHAYTTKAKEAVKTIIENKQGLTFVDEAGEKVNRLPESLKDFSEAIQQTKRHIYSLYDDLLKESGSPKVSINLSPVSKELDQIINSKVLQIKEPGIIQYANGIKERMASVGKLGVKETDELIKSYNNSLDAFYKNPTYDTATRASIDALIVNRLRGSLDDTVSNITGKGFQALKNKYGALKAIEKDVTHRAVVDSRKNIKGLIDFTDIFSAGDVIHGITTLNPGSFAKGVTQMAIKKAFKAINDPNNIVKNMFKDVDKIYSARPTVFNPDIMMDMPVFKGKSLSGPTAKARMGYQTKSLPSPKDVSYRPMGYPGTTPPVKPLRTPNIKGGETIEQPPMYGSERIWDRMKQMTEEEQLKEALLKAGLIKK